MRIPLGALSALSTLTIRTYRHCLATVSSLSPHSRPPQRIEATKRVSELERELAAEQGALEEARKLAAAGASAGPGSPVRGVVASAMAKARDLASLLREAERERDSAGVRVAEAQAALVRVQVRQPLPRQERVGREVGVNSS